MKLKVGINEFDAARIFCIGRNYRAHIKELNDEIPESPIIFCKSPFCLVAPGYDVPFPSHGSELHHEVELVVAIGKAGKVASPGEAESYIAGIGLGLDLTMRDLQRNLIKKGLPWEACKSFEASAPLGEIVAFPFHVPLDRLEFFCRVNNELRQQGCAGNMIFSIPELLVEISKIWVLRPGDLIYTGTPSGIGALQRGDIITIGGNFCRESEWRIVDNIKG